MLQLVTFAVGYIYDFVIAHARLPVDTFVVTPLHPVARLIRHSFTLVVWRYVTRLLRVALQLPLPRLFLICYSRLCTFVCTVVTFTVTDLDYVTLRAVTHHTRLVVTRAVGCAHWLPVTIHVVYGLRFTFVYVTLRCCCVTVTRLFVPRLPLLRFALLPRTV